MKTLFHIRFLSFLIMIFSVFSGTKSFSNPEELCKQAGGKYISFDDSGANKCDFYVFAQGRDLDPDSISNPIKDCDCGPTSCFYKNQCWIKAKGQSAWINSFTSTIEFKLLYSSSKDALLNESVTRALLARQKEFLVCFEYDYKDKLPNQNEITVSFAIKNRVLNGRLETSPNMLTIYPKAACINTIVLKLNIDLVKEETKFTYKLIFIPKL